MGKKKLATGTGWDQFATNERLFGVTTDYDETLYTTKLDTNDPEFRRKEKEASRLAREIERVRDSNAKRVE